MQLIHGVMIALPEVGGILSRLPCRQEQGCHKQVIKETLKENRVVTDHSVTAPINYLIEISDIIGQ